MASKNTWLSEYNMASVAILKLEKLMLFLHYLTKFHQIGKNVATLNTNSCMASKNAWWPESSMAAAAILNLTKLMLFLHLFTKFNQI